MTAKGHEKTFHGLREHFKRATWRETTAQNRRALLSQKSRNWCKLNLFMEDRKKSKVGIEAQKTKV